jgi:hypothetical protein
MLSAILKNKAEKKEFGINKEKFTKQNINETTIANINESVLHHQVYCLGIKVLMKMKHKRDTKSL